MKEVEFDEWLRNKKFVFINRPDENTSIWTADRIVLLMEHKPPFALTIMVDGNYIHTTRENFQGLVIVGKEGVVYLHNKAIELKL